MVDRKTKIKLPARKKLAGFFYKGNETIIMTGKEWMDLAAKSKFTWKRVGDPREGIRDVCGGGYEVHID